MKADKFYKICDIVEHVRPDITEGYFPTVEEMEAKEVDKNINDYLIMLLFFSRDPFKNTNYSEKNNEEYKKTVAYAKKILLDIKLE